MSQANVDTVRRALTEFDLSLSGGIEEAARAGLIAPDVEVDFSALYPDGPVLRGIEAWHDHVRSLPWGRSLRLEPERFLDVDDERVLVFMRATAEGEGSRVPIEGRGADEVTIRDGAVVRIKLFRDREEALEAAGLSE
jgi:SnoaL-like domain